MFVNAYFVPANTQQREQKALLNVYTAQLRTVWVRTPGLTLILFSYLAGFLHIGNASQYVIYNPFQNRGLGTQDELEEMRQFD